MCGITGAVWTDPQLAIEPPVLAPMTEVLRHLGCDDGGSYLGELRLRPLDEVMPGVFEVGHFGEK